MKIVIDINENDYRTLMINGGNCSISMSERIIDSVYQGKKLQEPILDKIRAEIEKAIWEDILPIIDETGEITDEIRTPLLNPDDVFEIIDKYKAESEENEHRRYVAKVITRGNCMICGKELTEGLFFCKDCQSKQNTESEDKDADSN